MTDKRLTTCLWFDFNAEEAVDHYLSIFPDGRRLSVSRYGEGGQAPAGTVMTIEFEMRGQTFLALNGGPHFSFTPAISFVVNCDTQEEIDHYWSRLCEGGAPSRCGWLKDRYGLSWQIVPHALKTLMSSDAAASARVMKALMTMDRLDIAALEKAYRQGEEAL